jgi:hypothetical protein
MRAFTQNFDDHATDYFPRRGTWDYVSRTRDHTGRAHDGIYRIPAAQTDSAMNGPLCAQFRYADAVLVGSLVEYAVLRETHWQRVSPTRFEPREPDNGATVFVDWRKEDGRWVIATIGSLNDYVPSAPRPVPSPDTLVGRYPRLPFPADGRFAGETDWFRENQGIVIRDHRYTKYGQPRELRERDVVYYATYEGVPVYAEPSALGPWRAPIIVYLPVDRTGSFQPYEGRFPC